MIYLSWLLVSPLITQFLQSTRLQSDPLPIFLFFPTTISVIIPALLCFSLSALCGRPSRTRALESQWLWLRPHSRFQCQSYFKIYKYRPVLYLQGCYKRTLWIFYRMYSCATMCFNPHPQPYHHAPCLLIVQGLGTFLVERALNPRLFNCNSMRAIQYF